MIFASWSRKHNNQCISTDLVCAGCLVSRKDGIVSKLTHTHKCFGSPLVGPPGFWGGSKQQVRARNLVKERKACRHHPLITRGEATRIETSVACLCVSPSGGLTRQDLGQGRPGVTSTSRTIRKVTHPLGRTNSKRISSTMERATR